MSTSKFRWTDKRPLQETCVKATQAVALVIEQQTKRNCPVDTGNLRRSYTTSTSMMLDQNTALATVGTNVFYAPFVEFGTRRHRAQPHLGPALEYARARYGE
jgi:HK97 gp10 family phage protein